MQRIEHRAQRISHDAPRLPPCGYGTDPSLNLEKVIRNLSVTVRAVQPTPQAVELLVPEPQMTLQGSPDLRIASLQGLHDLAQLDGSLVSEGYSAESPGTVHQRRFSKTRHDPPVASCAGSRATVAYTSIESNDSTLVARPALRAPNQEGQHTGTCRS